MKSSALLQQSGTARPVYMPYSYYVNKEISPSMAQATRFEKSDPETLDKAVSTIVDKLSNAEKACIMPGILA